MVGAQMSKIITEDMASVWRHEGNKECVFKRLEVYYQFQSIWFNDWITSQ